MQIRIFSIPAVSTVEMQEEMNKFLRSHRVLEVKQQYDVERGYWTFAVSYIESSSSVTTSSVSEKVDYKNILSPEAFDIFSKLRATRKVIAKDEGLPAYAIFTDKELAEIAQLEDLTPTAMLKIDGIGNGRAERYAERILVDFYPKENHDF